MKHQLYWNICRFSISGTIRVLIPAAVLVLLSACSKTGAWDIIRNVELHGGFGREISLEIDLTGVIWNDLGSADSSDIVNFPLLVRLNTTVDFDYPGFLESDGSDIRFFDVGGNPLAFETAHWDSAGPSAWWVRIPAIDKTLPNNTITLCYDYWWDDPPPLLSPGDTWSNNFVGVWHLDEVDGATTFRDSTKWGNDGWTGSDGMLIPALEPPPVQLGFGNARYFDATTGNPSFKVSALADEGSEGQLEAFSLGYWMRVDAWGQMYAFEKGDIQLDYGAGSNFKSVVLKTGDDQLFEQDALQWGAVTVTWLYFQITSNGSINTPPHSGTRVYNNANQMNGNINSIKGDGVREGNNLDFIQFCRQDSGTAKFAFDEIRLSREVRTRDWIILEYENMTGAVAVFRVSEQALQ